MTPIGWSHHVFTTVEERDNLSTFILFHSTAFLSTFLLLSLLMIAYFSPSLLPFPQGSWTEWYQRAPPETMVTGIAEQPDGGA